VTCGPSDHTDEATPTPTPFINSDAAMQCTKGFIDEDQPLIAHENQ
jgi:hypothetical protein